MRLPIAGQQEWSAADPHGMAYDNPQFWDGAHMESELHRVFEICNGCRLCFNLCPSFDVLFRRIDELDPHREEAEGKHIEGGKIVEEHEAGELLKHVKVSTENPVGLLQDADKERVVELCYECKLCFPKCPYVPPHEFAVDFPKLMLRSKMIGAREDGIAFRERFLGATDLVGSVMTKVAPIANAAAHNSFNRMLMEKTIGIARERQLPDYAGETFTEWWSRRAPREDGPDAQPVALFATCYVNYNDPRIAHAAVDVLERAGCSVECPEQVCCGMPKLDGGDVTLVDRCCGMDGTWGMKSEFFAESLKVAEGAARKVEAAEPEVVSSDCPLAGLQLRQKTGRPSYHPVRILSAAYQGEPLRSPRTDNPKQGDLPGAKPT